MKKLIFVSILFGISFSIEAQETTLASGGDALGGGGSSSYSVGQLVYTTNTGSNGSVSQGVQQGFEIFTLNNMELINVNLSAVTYPNPSSDFVVLTISDFDLNNLSYEFYNVEGKSIVKANIIDKDTQIGLQNLSLGIYILNVNQNNKILKTFKIIKN